MRNRVEFTLNGQAFAHEGEPNHRSLLDVLRKRGCAGTKEGCAEGDCGACTVAIVERDAFGKTVYRSINSCIALVASMQGREVITAEHLEQSGVLHPVQAQMLECMGSQCGFCTPGFVAAMFEGYYREGTLSPAQIHDQLNGNLCRCTGYRPIRDAMARALADKPARPADVFQLRLSKDAPALQPASLGGQAPDGSATTFHRPTSLPELLALRAAHPEAELVGGATEVGVYINKRAARYPIMIGIDAVAELAAIRKTAETWSLGAGASLTAIEEALAGEYPMIDKMLWAFASRPIRNRATLGGNLVTASPIGDMAPLLLALDASVQLRSHNAERSVPLAEFFTAYRKTVLRADELMISVQFARSSKSAKRLQDSFKVSKRRELDISIVSAAFVVDLDAAGSVVHARLAFGGVAATPARAQAAEAYLMGKLWNLSHVAAAAKLAAAQFAPLSDVRAGKAYRAALIESLLLKFYSGDQSRSQDLPLQFVQDAPWLEGDASRALRHESARGHVTGNARYVHDEAGRRPMLEMWPVTSPHAHAKLLKLESDAAARMPGVACILTAADIPGTNDVGAVRHDETLLAAGEVMFHGHMVAVVVAETIEQARAAAACVEVEYAQQPALIGIAAAVAADSFHTQPHVIVRGDVGAALAASEHRIAGSLDIGGQEHFYLEAQAAWAELGDDGDVFVSSSTQHPSEIQAVVAHVLAIPRSRVVVEAPRMGGGFGGKETQGNSFAALAALASVRTKRPVRIQLDRDLDMMLTGKRHPFHAQFAVGFTARGELTGMDVQLVSDGGWALDLSESITDRALFHLDNAYYVPAARFSGRVAKTHVVSHTAFRGFGGPQGMLVMEEILDRIARTLGLAPELVRERNLYRGSGETNTTHYGQDLLDNRILRLWPTLMQDARVAERRSEIAAWNAQSPHIKRGIAITPVKFGISFTATFLNQAGALVLIYRDGTLQVNHGGTEMGQGLHTKLQGIVMRELGLPKESIRMMRTRTDKVPNTSATAASAGSDLNGQAVLAACAELRGRLAAVARTKLNEAHAGEVDELRFADGQVSCALHPERQIAFAAVVEAAYFQQISLSATGFYRTPGIGYDKAKGKGKPFYYFAYGAAVAEVELDGHTGMKRVLDVQILHDVGDSLNPGVDRGQIEGAFVQGMGWLTAEELKWDERGRLLSHSASTYAIPSIGDAPEKMQVALFSDATQPGVVHGSKAVGEPPLMLAISVREALRDAVAAFGTGNGPVLLASPATHEALFHAIAARRAGGAAPGVAA